MDKDILDKVRYSTDQLQEIEEGQSKGLEKEISKGLVRGKTLKYSQKNLGLEGYKDEEHFATMAQVLFSLKSYIASVSYDNVL